jgi:hypothetical protein
MPKQIAECEEPSGYYYDSFGGGLAIPIRILLPLTPIRGKRLARRTWHRIRQSGQHHSRIISKLLNAKVYSGWRAICRMSSSIG